MSSQTTRPFRKAGDRIPLRTKLIAAVLALVIAALAAISFFTVVVLRSYLTSRYDDQVKGASEAVTALGPLTFLRGNPPGYTYQLTPANPNLLAGFQLTGSQLQPSQPSSGLGGNFNQQQAVPVPSLQTSASWATAHAGQLLTVGSQSGSHIDWRVMVEPGSYNGQSGMIVVAYNLGDINQVVGRLVLVDVIVGAAIVVVLAAVGIGVVQANLRPLNDIEMTAGQIAKGHLDHRIPERDPRTEIGSLGHSLNAMLAQIEQAFHAREQSERAAHESEERMRRFIADASHELRTPLTTIRGFAEYYRQRQGLSSRTPHPSSASPASGAAVPASRQGEVASDTPTLVAPARTQHGSPENGGSSPVPAGPLTSEELNRLMSRLESEAARMGLLVEDLLQLARLDQQRPLDLAPVDLLTLAADAVQDARIVAPDRKIDLIIDQGAAFIVNGDEPRLRQVLANLVNNALTHTPKGTPVRVRIGSGVLKDGEADQGDVGQGREGQGREGRGRPAVLLDVEDDGPGMTPEQAQRVFERFYRADAARNRASGGTGLGLAIVAGLVAAHGGTVSIRTAPDEGADFQVRLPFSPDAQLGDDEDEDEDEPPGPMPGFGPAGDRGQAPEPGDAGGVISF